MSRKSAREAAVHCAYEYGYHAGTMEEIVQNHLCTEFAEGIEGDCPLYRDIESAQKPYVSAVAQGVAEHLEELDGAIRQSSIGWDTKRISRIAMAILRVAIYEVLYLEEVPTGVAINEAVEIAKKYESEETVAFINGVLGGVVRKGNDPQ